MTPSLAYLVYIVVGHYGQEKALIGSQNTIQNKRDWSIVLSPRNIGNTSIYLYDYDWPVYETAAKSRPTFLVKAQPF